MNVEAWTKPRRNPRNGLRTSATLATVFTIVGHTFLGFEQAILHVFVALFAGYASALLFETVDARANGRPLGFLGGGPVKVVDWLLSAHMTAITLAFLMYTNDQLWALAFMVVVAIGSKYLFRIEIDGRLRHFLNPSNFGLVVGVFVFQWIGMLPWGLTTTIYGFWDWALTLFVCALGFRLNFFYTGRMPLIVAWLVGFVAQALIRAALFDNAWTAELALASNVPFVLFTFYMITDPMTSPPSFRGQVVFGLSIAAVYGVMMVAGLMYTLFYAVVVVTAVRGAWLYVAARTRVSATAPAPALATK